MDQPDGAPIRIDTEQPSVARMYDYFLGGAHNFAADRELARKILAIGPQAAVVAQLGRSFLRRAVSFMIAKGIRQFVDIGSGIPTAGNVHDVAQRLNPQARVAYVDIDPIAVAHSREILAGTTGVTVIQQDVRQVDAILDHPGLREIIDLDQPVGVLLVAVLHFIPDRDHPERILARVRDRIASGSYLAISHVNIEEHSGGVDVVTDLYSRTPTPLRMRTRDEVSRFFEGFHLLSPGVVPISQCLPDSPDEAIHAEAAYSCAGIGYKE